MRAIADQYIADRFDVYNHRLIANRVEEMGMELTKPGIDNAQYDSGLAKVFHVAVA